MAFDPARLQQVRDSRPPSDTPIADYASNAARTIGQGATFGFADEIEAAVRAPFSDQGYGEIVDDIRGQNADFAEESPWTAGGMEAGGGLVSGGAGLLKFGLKKGAGWANNLWRGSLGGAAEGAAYGTGVSETDREAPFMERAADVAEDAGMGAAGGALLGGPLGMTLGGVATKMANNKQARQILNTPSNDPNVPIKPDARVADKQLVPRGPTRHIPGVEDTKVRKHPQGAEAVKQGTDPRTVSIVRNSSPGDKSKMRQMLDMKLENMRTGQKEGTPKRIIGESMLSRYKHLNSVRSSAGSQIDGIVNKMGKVDSTQAQRNFNQRLMSMGAQVTPDGGDITFPAGSELFGQNGQQVVKNALKQARAIGDSPRELHNYKKWLDEQIYNAKGKKATDPLNSNVADFLDGVRADVNESLRKASPDYATVNDVYSEITDQFRELHRLGGSNFSPSNKYNDELLGNLSRRMVSNAQSAGPVRDVAEQLSTMGNKYGGKFDDDLYNLVEWQVELDRVLGATPSNSFQSEIQQAGESVARGDTSGLGAQAVRAAVNSARNVSPEGLESSLYGLFD